MSRRKFLIAAGATAASVGLAGLGLRAAWSDTGPAKGAATPAGGTAGKAPFVGAAAAGEGSYDYGKVWDDVQETIGAGKLTYRRCFDPTLPKAGKENWRRAKAPNSFYSAKPPKGDYKGLAEGKYDDQIRNVVKDLPAGTKFTMFHEPENDMSGQSFHRMFKRLHKVLKEERPDDVQLWYVAMAYQWRTNSKGHVDSNAGWIDAAKLADAVGIDIYAGSHFKALEEDKGFDRWWKEIRQEVGNEKLWGVIERGITADKGEAARLEILDADWKFVTAKGADAFLYWQSPKDGSWQLKSKAEVKAYQKIAAAGRS